MTSIARFESMRRNLKLGWVLCDVGIGSDPATTIYASWGVKTVHVELAQAEPRVTLATPMAIGPDAIVLNAKGAELEVLKGATAVLSNEKPVLWIACHPVRMTDYYHWGVTYLWKFLREYGYSWRLLDYDDALEIVAWHPDRPVMVDR